MQRIKSHKLINYIAILILVRIIALAVFVYMGVPIGDLAGSDAEEYRFVAHSILNGDGFLSNENNSWGRQYLGDNYYYCAEPGYPVFLSFFYFFLESGFWITIISNTLLYMVLILVTYLLCTHLRITGILSIILMLGIIFHGGINVVSNWLLPEVFRISALILVFWYVTAWYKMNNTTYLNTSILGFLTAIAALIRIPFFLIIIPAVYLITQKLVVTKDKYRHLALYISIVFIALLPWMFRNYTAFGYFNIDPRFHRGVNIQETVLKTYRITDNELFQDIKKMSEQEKHELFEKTDGRIIGLIKAYGLKLKELFRLYPSGGDFSSPFFQVISALFNLPYLLGLLALYFTKPFRDDVFWRAWKIFIILFVLFHMIAAGPHARYFLPLVPFGYIMFAYYLSEKFIYKKAV